MISNAVSHSINDYDKEQTQRVSAVYPKVEGGNKFKSFIVRRFDFSS